MWSLKEGERNMRLNEMAFANAMAVFIGVIYVLCGLAVAILPGISKTVAQSWFHGIDIAKLWSATAFPGNFILGLVSAVALTWVGGWVFAFTYNKLVRK